MTSTIALPDSFADKWGQSIYAFLSEKYRLSGSIRTMHAYGWMLRTFFDGVARAPDAVTPPDVFGYAYSTGLSGKEPSPATVSARIACVSSFFKFLVRMDLIRSNPCDRLDRPRTSPAVPRGLSAEEVRRLLAATPETPAGLRDRAIILTLVLTGRRRSEVLNLTVGDIEPGDPVYYRYRGKGGKRGRRELPRPAYAAAVRALAGFGKEMATMGPTDPLWPSCGRGEAVSQGAFYGNFRRYLRKAGLPPSGVHITRHTAAKLRRDAGAPLEEVSAFLDHSSLAVTSIYLRRLEGQTDSRWQDVASSIGVT